MKRFGRDIQAVIFDMDGTIFDTERIFYEVWALCEEEFGFQGREELFSLFAGARVDSVLEMLVQYFGDRELAQRVERYRSWAIKKLKEEYGIRLKPGAAEVLAYLWENRIPTALATSSLPDKMERQFRAVGLEMGFDAVVTGDMVEKGKPDPEIFLKAAQLLAVPIEQCIAVEDSPKGLQAAAGSGAYTVLIPDVVQPDETLQSMASEVLPSLKSLLAVFRSSAVFQQRRKEACQIEG